MHMYMFHVHLFEDISNLMYEKTYYQICIKIMTEYVHVHVTGGHTQKTYYIPDLYNYERVCIYM